MIKRFAAVFAAITLLFGLSACTAQKVDMATVSAVIDVRTPAEYAAGHLDGAINIDVESMQFATEVGSLDKAGTYVVYCHSGRRAAAAADQMKSLGFANVSNIGGISDASSVTGLPVVQ